MNLILYVLFIVGCLVVAFHGAIKLYQLFSGLDKATATHEIQQLFRKMVGSQAPVLWPNFDDEFIDGVRKNIVESYSSLSFDLSDGEWGVSPEGLPYYKLQMICSDEQKPEIEAIMKKLLLRALSRYGYKPSPILFTWISSGTIECLEMRYACTADQIKTIQGVIENQKLQVAEASAILKDEELENEFKEYNSSNRI